MRLTSVAGVFTHDRRILAAASVEAAATAQTKDAAEASTETADRRRQSTPIAFVGHDLR